MAGDVDARVQAILDRADRIAAERRRRAEAEAAAYLEAARRRVDAFADGRIRRMREASDALLAGTEAITGRLARTERLTHGIEEVADALATAAEAVAAEAARAPIGLPPIEHGPAGMAPRPLDDPPPAPGPDGHAAHDPSAGEVVRRIASSLPPRPGRRPAP